MTCKTYQHGGVTIIACSRERPKTCACGRRSTKLCDFPLMNAKAGKTCDRPLCGVHAHSQGVHESGPYKGESIDYCQAHHEFAQKRAKETA